MAVDAETKKYLEEVKKGKPRKFVMICKGVKILSVIVYKKGSVEKYKKQAKQEGTGQFYHGVVDGKGQNISFKLLTSDGFDKPPGKALILKDFLKSQAGMQFKPAYEIVDVLPGVNEADDPTEGPTDSLTVDPAALTTLAEKLANALKRLKPQMDKVINADPNRKNELHATMVQIAGEIKSKQFDQAKQSVTAFATLLKSLATQSGVSPVAESVDRPGEFAERRDALEPRLLKAQKADREKAAKLGAVWDYAKTQADADNMGNAFKALDRLEKAVEDVLASAGNDVEASGEGRQVSYTQSRLAWNNASGTVQNSLSALQDAIRREMPEEASLAARLANVLEGIDERLIAALDSALSASTSNDRESHHNTALGLITEYQSKLSQRAKQIRHLDSNPFVDCNIGETLAKTLGDMKKQLTQLA